MCLEVHPRETRLLNPILQWRGRDSAKFRRYVRAVCPAISNGAASGSHDLDFTIALEIIVVK